MEYIHSARDSDGRKRDAALEALNRLDHRALESLMEIIGDHAVPPRYADVAVGPLIQIGTRTDLKHYPLEGGRGPIESRPLSPHAGRVFDAVSGYLRRHPDSTANLSGFEEIIPLDRIPGLIDNIENSSGEQQTRYILLFCTLTHTSFPVIPQGFCGNSGAEAIKRMKEEGAVRQRESVGQIKAWWREHGQEPYRNWVIAAARRHVQSETNSRRELLKTIEDDNLEYRDFQIRQYDSASLTRFGPSAYETLLAEFANAEYFMKPYLLYLIALTRHPDADALVASQLWTPDLNLRYTAVAGLRVLNAVMYADDVRQVLRQNQDKGIAREAIRTLHQLAGADGLDAIAPWIIDGDDRVRDTAKAAFAPYMTTHAQRLGEIAAAQPDKAVGRALQALVDQHHLRRALSAAARSGETSNAGLETLKQMLAAQPEAQGNAIALIRQHELAELVPEVIELLHSTHDQVRSAAAAAILELGVPHLTLDSASQLLGKSLQLDRRIAAYTYARFGRAALPLVKKVALQWNDPAATRNAAEPAVDLLQILIREKQPGIEGDIVHLVKTVPRLDDYFILLLLLDDAESAVLTDQFLRHKNGNHRLTAIRVVGARRLVQHADRLFELAVRVPDDPAWKQAQAELAALTLSADAYQIARADHMPRPDEAWGAAGVLIDFDDPRAWDVALHCLNYHGLDWLESPFGLRREVGIGARLSKLKNQHATEFRAKLRETLDGSGRERMLMCLTTALVMEPTPADSDLFWSIASSSQLESQARVLAAVALARLMDRRVIPVIHELLRASLLPPGTEGWVSIEPMAFGMMPSSRWTSFGQRPRAPRLDWILAAGPEKTKLQFQHIDLAGGLRRLGDESLTEEALGSLVTDRGEFNRQAFCVLSGLVGRKAHDRARAWLEVNHPHLLPKLPALLFTVPELESDPAMIRPLLEADESLLLACLPLVVELQFTEAADRLAAIFPTLDREGGSFFRTRTLEALCRLGDIRGLDLVADDALLLAELATFLRDAPVVEFPAGSFKYNRMEDALRLQEWYAQHRDALRWSAQTLQFHVQPHGD